MAFPLLAAPIFSGIVGGLTTFFASRAATILTGLGLSFIVAKGLSNVVALIVSDIGTVTGWLQTGGGMAGSGGATLGGYVYALMAYAGVFDGINIMISGMMTSLAFTQLKALVVRLNA